MDYYIKLYSTVEDFDNRNPCDQFTTIGIDTIGTAVEMAKENLDLTCADPIAVVKVESDDQEEIEVRVAVKRDMFKLTWDNSALDIYIDNGDDKDPIQVAYWVSDEWEEDSETVTPTMITVMELFYTDPEEIFKRLNLPYLLVD